MLADGSRLGGGDCDAGKAPSEVPETPDRGGAIDRGKASVVIQDGCGRVLGQGEVPTTPEGFRRWHDAQRLPAGTPVALETGTVAFFVARELTGPGCAPIVVDARELRSRRTARPRRVTAGMRWTPVNSGLTDVSIDALAVDPAMPATVYAGVATSSAAGTSSWAFKSVDREAHWTPVNVQEPVTTLAIDPALPDIIYAGTDGGGMLKSSDAGSTWTAVNTGLESGSQFQAITALTIDPSVPTTLYAGTFGGDGVFKSSDGGDHWAAIDTGLPRAAFKGLAIDPGSPSTIYAAESPYRYYVEECGYQPLFRRQSNVDHRVLS